MLAQHRDLQKDLNQVAQQLKIIQVDANKIDQLLLIFKKDLNEHLNLENNIFYPKLLDQMREGQKPTADTEEFISEMGKIGDAVMAFLSKYDSSVRISDDIAEFKNDVAAIIDTLNIRIEAEEAGVYLYWE